MHRPIIALLISISISASLPKVAICDCALPQIEWKWSQKDMHIFEPEFSRDNREITFVRKKFWREEYRKKRKVNPRIADPEVVIVHLGKRSVERVGWGWAPCFSPDGGKIAYVHQKRPISGFRALASTLGKNEIVLYDRTKGKTSSLVRPTRGYLDMPTFSPDGSHVVFSLMDAVNGDFGGGVGVGVVNLKSKKQKILLSPEKRHGFYCIIHSPVWIKDELVAVREKPTTSAGTYLADQYVCELLNLCNGGEVIYSWGKREYHRAGVYGTTQEGNALIYDGYDWEWLEIDLKTKRIIKRFRDVEPSHLGCIIRKRLVSPNARMVAYCLCWGKVVVAEIGQPQPKLTWDAGSNQVHSITWSHDSKKLAAVVKHYKSGEGHEIDFEELVVFRVN